MKRYLFIACLALYSQMTQETAAQGEQTAPLPTCVHSASSGATFEIRNISDAHAECMEGTHAETSNDTRLCSCMASATKNDMTSFRVDKGVCYIYLASPPANDTGTQQIYVARNQTVPPTLPCCPTSFTMVSKLGCLYVKDLAVNRAGAIEQCKTLGGQIYSSSSPQNTLDLQDHLLKTAAGGGYWVAAEPVNDGTWQWRDGRKVAGEWSTAYTKDLDRNGAVLATGLAPPLNNIPDSARRFYVCQASSV